MKKLYLTTFAILFASSFSGMLQADLYVNTFVSVDGAIQIPFINNTGFPINIVITFSRQGNTTKESQSSLIRAESSTNKFITVPYRCTIKDISISYNDSNNKNYTNNQIPDIKFSATKELQPNGHYGPGVKASTVIIKLDSNKKPILSIQ